MAEFEGVTASSGLKVPADKKAALQALIDQFSWGELTAELEPTQDGSFSLEIWGYEFANVHPWTVDADGAKEVDYDRDGTDEFLTALRPYVPAGGRFVLQSIGHEKCRFPLCGFTGIVTPEAVEYYGLPCSMTDPEPVERRQLRALARIADDVTDWTPEHDADCATTEPAAHPEAEGRCTCGADACWKRLREQRKEVEVGQ